MLDSRAMDAAELLRALDDEHDAGSRGARGRDDGGGAGRRAGRGARPQVGVRPAPARPRHAAERRPPRGRRTRERDPRGPPADASTRAGPSSARSRSEAQLAADRIDVTLPGRRPRPGSLHPLTLVEREIVDVFTSLGFRVVGGPEIEDDWHNFQALNIPPDHPARTMKDSLYVAIPGHPELLLRTETSAAQIRTMQSQPPPVYIVSPGRVYRRETSDATHLPVFHQVEGLVVDEGITFAAPQGHARGDGEGAVRASGAGSGWARRTSRSWSRAPRSA